MTLLMPLVTIPRTISVRECRPNDLQALYEPQQYSLRLVLRFPYSYLPLPLPCFVVVVECDSLQTVSPVKKSEWQP